MPGVRTQADYEKVYDQVHKELDKIEELVSVKRKD